MKLTTTELDNWKVFFVVAAFGTFNQAVLAGKRPPAKSSSASSTTSVNSGSSDINHSLGKGIPANILLEIGTLDDHLKCFPKLLCTIYQDDSIMRRGFVNATELGVAYIKLLKAVHYASPTVPTSTTTTKAPKAKRPIIQVFQIPMGLITSYYSGRKDHPDQLDELEHPHYFRSHTKETPYYENRNDYSNDDYDLREDDIDRQYLREKVEMSQMMEELINEDKAEMQPEDEYSYSSDGGGGSVATSLLKSFLPFLGSRSMGKSGGVDDSKRLFRSGDRSKRTVTTPNAPHDTRRKNRRLYRTNTARKVTVTRLVNIELISFDYMRRNSILRTLFQCNFDVLL
ncbi:hypothetical protein Ocin01_07109 [Orchesella cincta]|uniref:Uncharacterized protein n=1 Tax=Orchesella cincta TaxID=48709 RepID=A0A1D2N2Q3_ORCCI|nr:hypothetical protein Ocin01_07109 [Orchesella cincta]